MREQNPHAYWAALAAALLLLAPSVVQADTKVSVASFEYDAAGLLVKRVIEPDAADDCVQTSFAYDSFGNRTQVSSQACAGASGHSISSATLPRSTSDSYGADGRFAVTSSNPEDQSETKTYDKRFGKVATLVGPNGLTTRWDYDSFGRKAKELRADGTYTTWAYLLCSQAGANCPATVGASVSKWVLVKQEYAANSTLNGAEQRKYYDGLDRVIRVQTQGFDGAGSAPTFVQDTEYDSLGRIKRKSNTGVLGAAAFWTEYSYDALGRVIQEKVPEPAATGGMATTGTVYNGLSTTVTNAKGQTKTTVKNASGQVSQVTNAQGATVIYRYDAQGNLVQTDAAGAVTTIGYDRRGRKTSMVDPSTGAWEYRYNVHDELVWQRDSLGQVAAFSYDRLGRMVQRSDTDLVSHWSYDKKFDGASCGKGVGRLCEAKADNGYKRVHAYDDLRRPTSIATVLDSPSTPAIVSFAYDANTSRLSSKVLPTGYEVRYQYTAGGYLKGVTGGGTSGFSQSASMDILAMDTQGQITQYRHGNQVITTRDYEPANGRLKSQSATQAGQGVGGVLTQSYGYDALGNLTTRADNTPDIGTQESFSYDTLNRLQLYTLLGGAVTPPQTTQVQYDARGNITYKSDVGLYWYDSARPTRLTNITLDTAAGAQPNTGTRKLTYAFDDYRSGAQNVNGTAFGNGNLWYTISQDDVSGRHMVRWETPTSFNMPREIQLGNLADPANPTAAVADRTLSFVYGPEHQRIKQQVQLTSSAPTTYRAGTTWYLNGEDSQGLAYEKEVLASGLTEHKHYVSAAGMVFAMQTTRTGTLGGMPASSVRYFHHDQLGSLAAITDESGAVVERLAYDPWGKRRNTNGTTDTADAIVGTATERGFTMHEHLDEIGVVHMNGRIYDPLNGRFMSADPFIQSPGNLQSFNRYSYVSNNPLRYSDPSGFFCFFSCDGPPDPFSLREITVRGSVPSVPSLGYIGFTGGAGAPPRVPVVTPPMLVPVGPVLVAVPPIVIPPKAPPRDSPFDGSLPQINVIESAELPVLSILDFATRGQNWMLESMVNSPSLVMRALGTGVRAMRSESAGNSGERPADVEDAADGPFSWWHKNRYTNNEGLRADWERETGESWPKDGNGRNYDVSHETPLADGGIDHISNVEPRPSNEHQGIHTGNGDYSRWGRRRR